MKRRQQLGVVVGFASSVATNEAHDLRYDDRFSLTRQRLRLNGRSGSGGRFGIIGVQQLLAVGEIADAQANILPLEVV